MASLGKDLATIRKKKDLNIDEMQQTTKISVPILRSIEDDSIFEQLDDNPIYTRNYVRSYARALGVDEKKVVKALNQVEAGTYDGSLINNEKEKEKEKNAPKSANSVETDKHSSSETEEKKNQPKEKKTSRKSAQSPSSNAKIAPKDWDWVQVGQKTNRPSSGKRKRNSLLIFILLIILIVGGFLIYFYFYADSNPNENIKGPQTDAVEQPGAPSDSLREALINKRNQPAMGKSMPDKKGELPDTLTIGIYAAGGKLDPVHVFTDILGKQNPYWVSKGDTIRFNFVNTVRIRAVDQYNRLQILFNGHTISNVYQQYYDKKAKLVELDRSVFENHPRWRSPVQ